MRTDRKRASRDVLTKVLICDGLEAAAAGHGARGGDVGGEALHADEALEEEGERECAQRGHANGGARF